VDLFGSRGREEATGRGVVFALEEYLKDARAGEIRGKTFAVQGFGNVGSWTARFLHERGGTVVAVADVTGAIHSRRGLDIPALVEHVKRTRSVVGFPDVETIGNDELLGLDVDVVVPAALGGVISSKNVRDIRARIVLEAANAPTTPEADEALAARGVVVLPDIYVNAGGVTVSYFEWIKNLSHVRFGRVGKRFEEAAFERVVMAIEQATGRLLSPEEHRRIARGADEIDLVNSGLEETMVAAYRQIREMMRQDARITDLRTAAFLNALRKVATSYMELGIFP
jgi:glutamate dehydrogenase (NAD(P)+)